MTPVSRKIATYLSLGFQYLMLLLMIVRGIIIPPLAARYIDHDLLGAWFASGNIVQWLMISEGGAWLYLRQKTAQEFGRNDKTALSQTIGSGAVILFLLAIVIIGSGLAIASWVPGWMNISGGNARELLLAFSLTVIGMGISLPACIPRAVAHGLQRQIAVNLNLLVAEVISLATIIVMIIKGYGVISLGIGPLVREVVHNLVNWPLLAILLRRIQVRPSVSMEYFRSMSGKMGWTFVNNLGGVMRRNVDALIVSQLFGNSEVLVVEWTKRAWEIFTALTTRASTAFTPAMAHLHGEGDMPKFRSISHRLFIVIAVATGITTGYGLAFNGTFVGLWVGSQFFAGSTFNLLLGLATSISVITFTLMEVLFATGNIRGPAIAQVIVSVARIVLMVLFAPRFGLLSIPLSMLVTETLGGLTYLALQWKHMLLVTWREILMQFLVVARVLVVATGIAWLWARLPGGWKGLFAHGILFGVALVLALLLTEPSLRSELGKLAGRFLRRTGNA
jgi:O-antigen/teichoic acid export membrane protein